MYLYILSGTPWEHIKIAKVKGKRGLVLDPGIINYKYDEEPVLFLDWLKEKNSGQKDMG